MRQRTPRTSSDTCVGTLMSLVEGPTRQLPPNHENDHHAHRQLIETAERCPLFAFISDYLRTHPSEPHATLGFFLCLHLAVALPKFRANRICGF